MMDYEIFKDVVMEKFLSYMPESYQNMEVRVDSVEKINCKLDGLSFYMDGARGNPSPTIYISVLSETRTPCFIRLQKFPKSHFHLYFLPSFCNISAFK